MSPLMIMLIGLLGKLAVAWLQKRLKKAEQVVTLVGDDVADTRAICEEAYKQCRWTHPLQKRALGRMCEELPAAVAAGKLSADAAKSLTSLMAGTEVEPEPD